MERRTAAPPITEGELIEIETRLSAIDIAYGIIEDRIADADKTGEYVPFVLEQARQRLALLRADVRRLIELARARLAEEYIDEERLFEEWIQREIEESLRADIRRLVDQAQLRTDISRLLEQVLARLNEAHIDEDQKIEEDLRAGIRQLIELARRSC